MGVEIYIGVAAVVLTVVGLLLAFHRHKTGVDNRITDERIKMQNQINNNALKILVIEKDMVEIKRNMIADFRDLRNDFSTDMAEFSKQNREDHQLLTKRLDVAIKEVTRAATLIEAHVDDSQ